MYKSSGANSEIRRESAAIGGALLLYYIIGAGLPAVISALISLFTGRGAPDFYLDGADAARGLVSMFCYLLSFAVPIYLLSGREEWPLRTPRKPFGLLAVPVFFVLLQAVNIFTRVFTELFRSIGMKEYSSGLLIPESPPLWALFLIQYVLLPAVFEELLFRGAVLGRLRRFGDWFAVLFSSLLFTVLHGSLAAMPGIFLMSAVFGYMAVESRSLIPPMAMHFLNNAIVIFDLAAAENPDPSLRNWFNVGVLGAGMVSALVLFRAYLRALKKAQREKPPEGQNPERGKGLWQIMLSPPMIVFFLISAAFAAGGELA